MSLILKNCRYSHIFFLYLSLVLIIIILILESLKQVVTRKLKNETLI
jgi:hypothetical protein